MKISIFIKTFLVLLISFSVVFLLSMYISYNRFSPLYIKENVENVKSSILSSVDDINAGTPLEDTDLQNLSSETAFIRFKENTMAEEIGPNFLAEGDVIDFVISIYDSEDSLKDGLKRWQPDLRDRSRRRYIPHQLYLSVRTW